MCAGVDVRSETRNLPPQSLMMLMTITMIDDDDSDVMYNLPAGFTEYIFFRAADEYW